MEWDHKLASYIVSTAKKSEVIICYLSTMIAACLIGQSMVVFGGWVPHKELNDLYVLDLYTMTWTKHSHDVSPPSRQLHAACVVDGKMIMFGGYSKNKRVNDLHVYCLGIVNRFG